MKPIQTIYKGYNFRSRLEARWAVFFDALGLNWEYEVEGFDLDCYYYLPDFKITSFNGNIAWYEVKPKHITHDDKFDSFFKKIQEQSSRNNLQGLPDGSPVESVSLLTGDPIDFLFPVAQKIHNDYTPYLGQFELLNMCPRCGVIDDCNYNEINTTDSGILFGVNNACHPCDFDTPCGRDNGYFNDGFLGGDIIYEPYKGTLLFSANSYMIFFHRVANAALKARQARF